jgi:HEAT repeat protein
MRAGMDVAQHGDEQAEMSCGRAAMGGSRAAAGRASGSEYRPERAQELVRALDGRGEMSSQEARRELVRMGAPTVPILLEALQATDTQVRWEAAKALGEIRSPAGAGGLVEALEDEDGGVRWVAAEGLIALERASLDPLLHALLRHSESAWLRAGAHHSLTHMRHDELAPILHPIVRALEGPEPAISLLVPCSAALEKLGLHRYAQG